MKVSKHGCVWMIDETTSVARAIAVDAMSGLGLDIQDWRKRDKVINAISERVNEILNQVHRNRTKRKP